MLYHLQPFKLKHLHNAEYVKCLGKGSFGDVKLYKCKEKDNLNCICNQYFVVKQLKNKKYDKKRIRKMLINEYTIGTLLNHPNIRKTIDIDFNDNSIIFEYFLGVNFLQYIDTQPLLSETFYYFEQLIDGVCYMHNIGIAHMDLKLENIMIDLINKNVKIIDFGESKVFRNTFCMNQIIVEKGLHGSLPYIAPEEFNKNPYNPEKVDVWSCGIILYEIIYGSYPWLKASSEDIKYQIYLKSPTQILQNIKSQDIIKKMLTPDPDKRCCINEIKIELNKNIF
jgi:protein-serine/threonine kinase